jgi:hypothetical protein
MTYRIYYNRASDWPQIWSVDEGSQATEINVQGFELSEVSAGAVALPKEARHPDNTVAPSAWLEVRNARLDVVAGIAVFTPDRD